MAIQSLTNTNISDTYVGVIHAGGAPLSAAGRQLLYDGYGNASALSIGRIGTGASVTGNTVITGNLTNTGIATSNSIETGNITASGNLLLANGVTNAAAFIEVGNGRTGNGTTYIDFHTSPTPDYDARIIKDAGANGDLSITNLGTGSTTLTQNNGPIVFVANGEKMRITADGKVGINNGSPIYNLDVTGTFHATGAAYVGGVIYGSNDIVAYSTSDKNLKDNIQNITAPLDKISKINGVTFDWNSKQDIYTGSDVGVIAQEIEEVLPSIVTTRGNGYKAVNYEKIVPLLIEAIKELKAQNDNLKLEIIDIQSKLK